MSNARDIADSNLDSLTVDTDTLVVDSTNNRVGIGTSSPNRELHVSGLATVENTAGNGAFLIYPDSAVNKIYSRAGNATSTSLPFAIHMGSAERMRIDDSGNVLVGMTSGLGTFTNAGVGVSSSNYIHAVRDGNIPLFLGRKTSDGHILRTYKDSTISGAVGVFAGYPYFGHAGQSGAGLLYVSTSIRPFDVVTESQSDNDFDLGQSSYRFDDIYATNGTIQTSDANEKQQIASLTAAEITAAKAISKLFKTFKWNDKVEAKGDAARTHAGVIAQDVQQAMADAGLDAGDYAFFISTTWWETQTEVPAVEADEENGIEAADAYTRTDTYDTAEEAPEGATERTRLGIRYPELLAFVSAATEQRLTDIETRLTALETN